MQLHSNVNKLKTHFFFWRVGVGVEVGWVKKELPCLFTDQLENPSDFRNFSIWKKKKKNTVLFWVKEVLASPLFWELQLTSFRKRRDHPQRLPTSANEMINKVVVAKACRTKGGLSQGNRDEVLRLFLTHSSSRRCSKLPWPTFPMWNHPCSVMLWAGVPFGSAWERQSQQSTCPSVPRENFLDCVQGICSVNLGDSVCLWVWEHCPPVPCNGVHNRFCSVFNV